MFDRRTLDKEIIGQSGRIRLHLYNDFGFDDRRQFTSGQMIAYVELQGISPTGNSAISQRLSIDLNGNAEAITSTNTLFSNVPAGHTVTVDYAVVGVSLLIDINADFNSRWHVSIDMLVYAL